MGERMSASKIGRRVRADLTERKPSEQVEGVVIRFAPAVQGGYRNHWGAGFTLRTDEGREVDFYTSSGYEFLD